MKFIPHPYQIHMLEHVITHSGSGLFAEMGLGKSCVALTAADYFLNDTCEISRVLIIAPKKVAESVWSQEGAKWDHLKHLRFSLVLGSVSERKKALHEKADIYVINRENVPWLVSSAQGKWRFDMVIVDESSSFKAHDSKRFRALKAVLSVVKRIIILTGTPMPNSILDLWSQIYLLDRGKRLGDNFSRFRERFFEKDPYRQFVWNLRKNVENIDGLISDICISLKNEDYIKLPERIENIIEIKLTAEEQKKYDKFEKDEILFLSDEQDITAINAAALTNKLLQFANGAVYDDNHNYHEVHTQKLDYLEEIVECANGKPVFIFYVFRHDLFRIMERLKKYKPQILKTDQQVQAWNREEIPVLLAHPASAGHGLNLQGGGDILVFFGLSWDLDFLLQGSARFMRQGRVKPLIIHYLLTANTMDMEVYKVLQLKENRQETLMQAVKAKVDKYLKSKKIA